MSLAEREPRKSSAALDRLAVAGFEQRQLALEADGVGVR